MVNIIWTNIYFSSGLKNQTIYDSLFTIKLHASLFIYMLLLKFIFWGIFFSSLGEAMENARSQIIKIMAGDEQDFISGVLGPQ